MLPDLESLRCFEAAAVHRSFRAAAAQVALSPAAFSERIRRLEEVLGAELFRRTSRRVELTAAGERLLPQARRCLDEARACLGVVRDDAAPMPVALRIGTRYELGLSWLVPALADLRASRPERTLHLYFADSPDLMHRLEGGELDAIISSVRLSRAGLEYGVLHEEEYVLVARPDVLRERPLRGPADAAAHTLLDTHRDLPLFRYFLDARRGDEVWAFGAVEHLGTIAAIRMRLLDGAGVAVLPRYFVSPDLAAGLLVAQFPELRLGPDYFRLIWRAGHPLARALSALAGELRARPLR